MKNLQIFKVYPTIPEPLVFLDILSRNLWWSWNHDAIDLFRRMDPARWRQSHRNPVAFLAMVPRRRFLELMTDASFIAHLRRVEEKFNDRIANCTGEAPLDIGEDGTIAYFSMEFGIHESLPIVAGGLGVLAGDHLKSASCCDLPLTGIGLLFREGYFHQYLDHNGWQQESYPEIDLFSLPVKRAEDPMGRPVMVEVASPLGEIRAQVWEVYVGRIRLLLLDANLLENPRHIQNVTARLYAADADVRIAQEALLGIGGIRALVQLGLFPRICHMNEGHCAFAGLERMAQVMKAHEVDLPTAKEICLRSGVFTTHTPVGAGHDEFSPAMVTSYLAPFSEQFGVPREEILSWGQVPGYGKRSPFYMSVLGMTLSGFINGVSQLHGEVARKMWTGLWPHAPVAEVPISHVTNGIHVLSFISHHKADLFEKYLSPDWERPPFSRKLADRISTIDQQELWHLHNMDRSRLVRAARKLLVQKFQSRSAPRNQVEEIGAVLNPDTLTICFARRFAAYKRADLLLRDPGRLEAIITSPTMPVQFVFAGKAHPDDKEGKALIQKIVEFSKRRNIRNHMVFLEDYNINIARYMVQGADVWLNTPRRPLEACGTSGMKAALNGGLNVSILDGWWCEGYAPERGWAIADDIRYPDNEYQDIVESQALYNVLENEVIPCFYERKNGNPPERWISMMKESMKMAMLNFSSHRMIKDYTERFYLPSASNVLRLTADNAWIARDIALNRQRLNRLWRQIRIEKPEKASDESFFVGDTFRLTATVFLGELTPEDVDVQIYYGQMCSLDEIRKGCVETMKVHEDLGNGAYRYACSLTCAGAGRFGYTARAIPCGDEIMQNAPEFMTWAE